MLKKLNKTCMKIFICSIIIYIFYVLVTPITISMEAYLGIFIYSVLIVLFLEMIFWIFKCFLDKNKSKGEL